MLSDVHSCLLLLQESLGRRQPWPCIVLSPPLHFHQVPCNLPSPPWQTPPWSPATQMLQLKAPLLRPTQLLDQVPLRVCCLKLLGHSLTLHHNMLLQQQQLLLATLGMPLMVSLPVLLRRGCCLRHRLFRHLKPVTSSLAEKYSCKAASLLDVVCLGVFWARCSLFRRLLC